MAKGNKGNKRMTRGRDRDHGAKGYRKQKETEVNVPDSSLNKEDLAAIIKAKTPGRNDPEWYASNPSLLRDSASFPFSWPVGSPMDWDQTKNNTIKANYVDFPSVPGIMAISFAPTIGVSRDQTSPINIAARQIYSFVRHANSGHSNYDSPDLMMYLLAMDSAYMWLSYMTRIYGTAMVYSVYNRYLPKALLKAMGADFEDVHKNLAQLRFYINEFAYKIASMCVPNGMYYFTRHAWMCNNVYKDSPNEKSQLYVFTPANYYVFREAVEGPGFLTLRSTELNTDVLQNLTVANMVEIGKEILEPIIGSEDFNIMSGDILKAFGGDNLIKIAPISEDYTVMPVYVPEVNAEIENLTCVGGFVASAFGTDLPTTPAVNDITQSTDLNGAILQQMQSNFRAMFGGTTEKPYQLSAGARAIVEGRHMINFHVPEVDPALMMVGTRLHTWLEPTGPWTSPTGAFYIGTSGSEVVKNIRVFTLDAGDPVFTHSIDEWYLVNYLDFTQLTDINKVLNVVSAFAKFDWAPAIIFCGATAAGNASILAGDTLDVDNYTLITEHDLKRMNETAMLSLFSVPQMAALSAKPNSSR